MHTRYAGSKQNYVKFCASNKFKTVVALSSRVSKLCIHSAILFQQICPSVCPSHSCILYLNECTYRQTLSSFRQGKNSSFFSALLPLQNSNRGTPSLRALNTQGGEIYDFRQKSPFISETVRDRHTVTIGSLTGSHRQSIDRCRFQ